jgi:bifunctional DNase/RNase
VKPLDVLGVRVETPTNQPIVLLQEQGSNRCLPIWIGAAEAAAIAYAQQGVEPPRPLTHDLVINILAALERPLVEVRITELVDQVFHAELHFADGVVVESRSSDAIALALRAAVPILGADELLDEASVPAPTPESESPEGAEEETGVVPEDEVERFKEFLDHVSADDFEAGPGPQSGS